MPYTTDDLRIDSLRPLISPAILIEKCPLTDAAEQFVNQTRQEAADIVSGKDDRLLVVVGPCSIHDTVSALEYAHLIKAARERFQDDLCLIMRVYFEKPRTTIGWKGLINDPDLDNSFNINEGLKVARQLLVDIVDSGVPCGSEFLDTIVPQFIADVISWGAIGARTTESQVHRELASGLSMPVGFKNGTDGNVQIAIDALGSSRHPHHFLSITKHGLASIVSTTGNDSSHVILRGSKTETNYDSQSVQQVADRLQQAQLSNRIMVDCSHGNSSKDHTRQAIVAADLAEQVEQGSQAVCGLMLESNLVAGKQKLTAKDSLAYGQSITDACIDWPTTEQILENLANAVQARRQKGER